jgi:O-antigen/teichoic acid export membrane protein
MSLNKALAQNTAIQIIGKVISTGLGLAAVAILTRELGTVKFGWYVTATSFLQFIGILIDFGFTVTASNMLSEPEHDKTKLFNTIFTWRFFTALATFGIAPIIILFFPYGKEIKIAVAVTSLSFFSNTLNQVFIGYYRQKLSMFIATASEILGRVILVGGFIILSVTNAGFLPLMSIITISAVTSTVYLIYKFGRLSFCFDRTISKALFYKMWPTALSVIFNSIYLQADRVILPLFVSQSEVGLYGAAYRVLDIVIQIAALVMGMVMPLITYSWSRNHFSEFKERYQLAIDLIALLLFPVVAGLFVLAEPIMRFVAGASFIKSGLMLQWLSISILGTAFGMAFGHIVLAINRQKEALLIYGTDAILSLTGYLIFIPSYGWIGAVWVTIFSEIYAGLFLLLIAVVYSGVIPDLSRVSRVFLASVLMGTIVMWSNLSLFPSVILGVVIYSALILMLKVVKKSSVLEILNLKNIA